MPCLTLADNSALRQVLHYYFAWAATTTISRYHQSADDAPNGLSIPHWSWDGLQMSDHTTDKHYTRESIHLLSTAIVGYSETIQIRGCGKYWGIAGCEIGEQEILTIATKSSPV